MTNSDPHLDYDTCFLSISPGGSSAEVHAWAAMLYQQYRRFAERHEYEVNVICVQEAEEGIAGVTLEIRGDGCARQLAGEHGVHSLVRISPFDEKQRRHTSFASVDCAPGLLDGGGMQLGDSDFRVVSEGPCGMVEPGGSGPSGPVRVTHLSTGLSIVSANGTVQEIVDRAKRVLSARVYHVQQALQAQEDGPSADDAKVPWGSSMRKYVLDPYQLIKDLRLDVETADVGGVLDGNLDVFISCEDTDT